MRHVDWEVVRCLVIAGPGFTKDSFKAFLDAEAVRQDNRYLAIPMALNLLQAGVPSLGAAHAFCTLRMEIEYLVIAYFG